MADSRLRIALVGVDHWYSAFSTARSIAESSTAELVGVADADPDRARQVAGSAGVERVTTDPSEFLNDSSVQAVASFISVDRNPEICIQAVRNGKHVISVKPLARTLDEATEIANAVREAGVVFLPSESRNRLSPQHQRIKEWYSHGRLGKVISAYHSLWSSLPQSWPGQPGPGWWGDPSRVPGGGWIDHSIYYIDFLRWLLGEEVAQVSGVKGNLKYPDLPVEDYGVATLRFEGGAISTQEVTWHAPKGGFRSEMNLVGTEGAVAFDSLSGKMSVSGSFPPFEGWVQVAPESTFAEAIDEFVSYVREGKEPVATVEDAWRNLAACLAFYEAAESGRTASPQNPPSV